MAFKFLEEVALADVAFEATGKDLNELFQEAAMAVAETMINTSAVKPKIKHEVELENEKLDLLLFDWLQEQVMLKDSEGLFFSKFKVEITEKNKKFKLKGEMRGEPLDYSRHELRSDVKAVTMHLFEVKKKNKEWFCRVVLDI